VYVDHAENKTDLMSLFRIPFEVYQEKC